TTVISDCSSTVWRTTAASNAGTSAIRTLIAPGPWMRSTRMIVDGRRSRVPTRGRRVQIGSRAGHGSEKDLSLDCRHSRNLKWLAKNAICRSVMHPKICIRGTLNGGPEERCLPEKGGGLGPPGDFK